MRRYVIAALITSALGTGCGIEEAIRKNDDRYAMPGALDSPLTGVYSKYAYRFMGQYQVTHEWVNTTACSYRSIELPNLPNGRRSNSYAVPEIYEIDGKTWQASSTGLKPIEFDTKVRSVKWISREKGKEGEQIEIGFRPLCFESWWATSHYLRVRMQRRSLAEFEAVFSQSYPEGQWRSESINGLLWRVQSVPPAKLRPRPLNGVGGPYQSWLVALGDTGYAMSFEMGASQESMVNPSAHAAIEGLLHRLVNSLKVERLTP